MMCILKIWNLLEVPYLCFNSKKSISYLGNNHYILNSSLIWKDILDATQRKNAS